MVRLSESESYLWLLTSVFEQVIIRSKFTTEPLKKPVTVAVPHNVQGGAVTDLQDDLGPA